ncbi:MAG: Lrp/AsnC family transcriptional regulator [Solirubrobacterales bacterium]
MPAAAKRRLDRLEAEGVITGYSAKLGRPIEALTELRFAGSTKLVDIAGIAADLPEVDAVHTIAGDPRRPLPPARSLTSPPPRVIDLLRRSGKVNGDEDPDGPSQRDPAALASIAPRAIVNSHRIPNTF